MEKWIRRNYSREKIMYFCLPSRYYNHWDMLRMMVLDNYLNDTTKDHAIIFEGYLHDSIDNIRKQITTHYDKLVAYQLEPLVPNHWWTTDHIVNRIKDADEIWDYDLQNIEILNSHGLNNVKFKPTKYSNSLKRINNDVEQDIDVLFYGSPMNYRTRYVQQIVQSIDRHTGFDDCNFVWLVHNITDKRLDDFIARSKIILNINPYEGPTRQQQTRIFYPLINNKCVVSEASEINYFGLNINQFSNFKNLGEIIRKLLIDDNWKKQYNYSSLLMNQNYFAIFYFIDTNQSNWQKQMFTNIEILQKNGLYDMADYMHFAYANLQSKELDFYKVNRVTEDTTSGQKTLNDAKFFSRHNENYKILFINNDFIDFSNLIKIKSKLKNTTDDIIYFNSHKRSFFGTASALTKSI